MGDKISVIIPVYNVEKYLDKCIMSVINQSYKNLEIIIVDDWSTDNSRVLCDKYAKIDNRIKVFHKKNGGLSDARNFGLKHATGEFIAFLDSDDWVDKDLYKILYDNIFKYKCDISVCKYKKVYNEDEKVDENNNIELLDNISALKKLHNVCDENRVQMIVAWNKLYKRELLNSEEFPIGKIHEDEFLTPQLLYKANKIVFSHRELIYYRQNPNSIMNREFNIKRLDYLYAIKQRNIFFKSNGLEDIYTLGINLYVRNIIIFYFNIKISQIENKDKIMKLLKQELRTVKGVKEIENKNKIKINIFLISPNIYNLIYMNLNPKFKGIIYFLKEKVKSIIKR